MPLHDVGYRPWTGVKSHEWTRWLAVTVTGIQIAFRSSWLGRTLIVSWVPAVAFAVGFFMYEQSITQPRMREVGGNMLMMAGAPAEIVVAATGDPAESRHDVWSALLMGFMRYPQAVLMVVVMGIVAPRLISFDLRNRGYLLYFSRPITIAEYIAGKLLVLWAFLAIITTLPALLLYLLGLGLASDLSVIWVTWDLPLRTLAASLLLMLPTASVALACSAISIESRYAAFSWFALWIIGWMTFSVLSSAEFADRMQDAHGPEEMQAAMSFHSRWEIISPYHTLGAAQQWVYGLFPEDRSIAPVLAVLGLVTLTSLAFVYRKLHLRMTA